MRKRVLLNSRKSTRFDTSIQLTINQLLDSLHVIYTREKIIEYYAVDNYLDEYNLIIEVMGDYWHTFPLKYNKEKYKINDMQQRGLLKDKQKHAYILNHYGIEILYLWEKDINTNLGLCKQLLLKYIQQKGKLENYHSFNWTFDKNRCLVLNHNIIIPYQQQTSKEYSSLLKKNIS